MALPVVCVASDVMSSHASRMAVASPTLAYGASEARPSWSKIVALAVLSFHCTQRFQSSRQLYAGMHVAPSVERCVMDPRPLPKYWHTIRLDVSAPARYVPHFAGHSAKEPLFSIGIRDALLIALGGLAKRDGREVGEERHDEGASRGTHRGGGHIVTCVVRVALCGGRGARRGMSREPRSVV